MAYVLSYLGTAVLVYVLHIGIEHTQHPLGITVIEHDLYLQLQLINAPMA